MKVKLLCALIFCQIARQAIASGNDLKFNPAFLNGESSQGADLSWISSSSTLPPGDYNITVYINDTFAFTDNVSFRINDSDNAEPQPCFTAEQFAKLGLASGPARDSAQTETCIYVSHYVPESRFQLDQKSLALHITVPQSKMRNLPRDYINPASWDYGITSAWLNYVLNGSNSRYRGETRTRQEQLFASLNSGVNLGAWRLRDFTTWNKQSNEFTHVQSWLQRDIPTLRAQVYAGETYTSSQVFDSIGLRGIALKTDDNMLPASLMGYAPEVRGIARSDATVTVRQNGNIIYQTSVPPGAFVLNDLYPTSSGGDLSVTIQENDGSKTLYTIPFASVPNLVRNGQVKYAFGAGKFRPGGNQDAPSLAQGELFYGWKYGLTFYGGVQASDRYTGIALGAGQNLGSIGAYSFDITHARSQLADDRIYSGNSVRLRYSKLLNDAGTRINFFSLRYSTQGFYSFSDTTYKAMAGGAPKQIVEDDGTVTTQYDNVYNLRMSRKARNQMLLTQPMGPLGSLSLSWDQQTYWRTSKTSRSLQLAWNATLRDVSLGISLQRSTSLYNDRKDNLLTMSLSIPLGNRKYSTRARMSTTHSGSTGTVNSAGLSGYVPGNENLFYSVNQRQSKQERYGGDASLQYDGQWGDYSLGYSYASDAQNISYGMSGGVVLHEDGLTLSQPLGNTNILVKAPGAGNVSVLNQRGIKTDSRGYAVIAYATPYRVNQIGLDVTTAGNNVELDNTMIAKTPTDGALVRATLATVKGAKAMFIVHRDASELPFGTLVSSDDDKSTGIVGDGGSLYLSGLAEQGILRAVWGRGSSQSCTIRYQLDKHHFNSRTGLYSQEVKCQ
ncbi:TPA: fimbrial biogenesis outer membrane usher protein [Enterobacter chengduensis]|nr:fimbrial biogenesis outer membrane usher protein [Enterobacter chengduensis]